MIEADRATIGMKPELRLQSLIEKVEGLNRKIVGAIGRDDPTEVIKRLDHELKDAYGAVSEFVPRGDSERRQLLEYAIDMIEANAENEFVLRFFLNIIRNNI